MIGGCPVSRTRTSHFEGYLQATVKYRKYPACARYSQPYSGGGSSSDAAFRCRHCCNLLVLSQFSRWRLSSWRRRFLAGQRPASADCSRSSQGHRRVPELDLRPSLTYLHDPQKKVQSNSGQVQDTAMTLRCQMTLNVERYSKVIVVSRP